MPRKIPAVIAPCTGIVRSLLSVICVLLIGCLGDRSPNPGSNGLSGSDTTAAAVLRNADRSALDQAVSRLASYDYTRARKITVLDESGGLVLDYAYSTRFSGASENRLANVVDSSLAGKGSAGLWKEYAGSPSAEDTMEWGRRLLPSDPLVLGLQGTGYYRYTDRNDTTIGDVQIRRIEATLISGVSRPGIQSGLFYVSGDGETLVGFDLLFAHQSLLFDEQSRFRYLLQRATDEKEWLPLEVTVNTFLNLPLSKGQRFELRARYSDPVPNHGD